MRYISFNKNFRILHKSKRLVERQGRQLSVQHQVWNTTDQRMTNEILEHLTARTLIAVFL